MGSNGGNACQFIGAAQMVRFPGLDPLVATLGGGDTTRLIGGAVRDSLLGEAVSDVDLATRLTPDTVIERLNAAGIKTVPTGIAHGTVTALTETGPVEITTLRRDVTTDGRRATVAFTDDWKTDAARRDFTINALSANPETGEVFDYFDGRADLAIGHVRFIGIPLQRIAEDHLRILRFFRFYARFGRGEPDGPGYDACRVRANDLMALSRERIAAELLKLLACPAPVVAVRLMLAGGIFKPVLPEIDSADCLERLVARERGHGDGIRRLAALIGPRPSLARDIALRLKLSKAQTHRLIDACGWTEPRKGIDALAYRLGQVGALDRLLLGDGTASEFEALQRWKKTVFPITGGALIARGIPSGPAVSQTLARIESAWVEAGFPTGPAFEAWLDEISPATPPQN